MWRLTGGEAEVVAAVLPDGHGEARVTAVAKRARAERRQLLRAERKSFGSVIIHCL
jgi:hypothetical protein